MPLSASSSAAPATLMLTSPPGARATRTVSRHRRARRGGVRNRDEIAVGDDSARLRNPGSAPSVRPPAASMASATRAPASSSTIPGSSTAPATETMIVSGAAALASMGTAGAVAAGSSSGQDKRVTDKPTAATSSATVTRTQRLRWERPSRFWSRSSRWSKRRAGGGLMTGSGSASPEAASTVSSQTLWFIGGVIEPHPEPRGESGGIGWQFAFHTRLNERRMRP